MSGMKKSFHFLGDCVGSTVEVDPATSSQEMLLFRRVKVKSDIHHGFPSRVDLWLEDLRLPIEVEIKDFSESKARSNPKICRQVGGQERGDCEPLSILWLFGKKKSLVETTLPVGWKWRREMVT